MLDKALFFTCLKQRQLHWSMRNFLTMDVLIQVSLASAFLSGYGCKISQFSDIPDTAIQENNTSLAIHISGSVKKTVFCMLYALSQRSSNKLEGKTKLKEYLTNFTDRQNNPECSQVMWLLKEPDCKVENPIRAKQEGSQLWLATFHHQMSGES